MLLIKQAYLNPIMMGATQTRHVTETVDTNVVPLFWNVIFVLFRVVGLAIFIVNILFGTVGGKLGFLEAVWVLK